MMSFYKISINKIQAFILFTYILSGKFSFEVLNNQIFARYFIFIVLIYIVLCRQRLVIYKMDVTFYGTLIFCSTLIFSATWNLGGNYVLEYLLDLLMMVLTMLLIGITLRSKDDIVLFLNFFLVTGILYSVLSIASVFAGERASLLIGGPNVTVRIIFLGLLGLLEVRPFKNYNYIFVIILLAGIFSTGSRGGIISSLICLTLYSMLGIRSNFKLRDLKINISGLAKGLWLAVAFFYIYDSFQEQIELLFRARIIETLVDNVHLAGRDELFTASIEMISQNIFWGQGLASYYDNAVGFYPHNLFLQLFMDAGLLSIINIIVIIFLVLSFMKNRDKIIFYAIPFYLIAHMVSGSYYDLRYMFIFWMLGFLTIKSKRNI